MIDIENLTASVEENRILSGLKLSMGKGEIHAVMGPNGAGKSTLAKIFAGHPSYEVEEGSVKVEGNDILELDPEERAHLGVFVGFQYPTEVHGVSNQRFLKLALNACRKARGEDELDDEAFAALLEEKIKLMSVPEEFKERNLNEGFSGGEKKRNEILQMLLLDPKVAILDETDSGLDIDAMKVVAAGVNNWMTEEKSLLLITHYHRLLEYIKPDYVHVLIDGRIVKSGGPELALELEKRGYDWLEAKANS